MIASGGTPIHRIEGREGTGDGGDDAPPTRTAYLGTRRRSTRGGVRLGTPALTTRGLDVHDFDAVAEFLHRGCTIAVKAQELAASNVRGEGDVAILKGDGVNGNGGTGGGKVSLREV